MSGNPARWVSILMEALKYPVGTVHVQGAAFWLDCYYAEMLEAGHVILKILKRDFMAEAHGESAP